MDESVYDRTMANLPGRRLAGSFALVLCIGAGATAAEPALEGSSKAPRPWIPAPETAPSTARCVPPAGDPVPADSILVALRAGKSVDLQGKIVEGNLDADRYWGAAGERKASLRVVPGRLRLDSCRVTGNVSFTHAVFVQDLVLSCVEIGGDLDLTDSEVRGSLFADRARIAGDVRLTNVRIDRDLSLKKSVLRGRLDMSGASLHAVNLQECSIERSLDLSDAIVGASDLSLAKIDGPAKLHDALLLGAFMARDATFGRTVALSSVRASGSIDLGGASVGDDVSLFDVSTEADLVLSGAFGGSVDLNNVSVGRDLSLASGRYLDLGIKGVTVRGGSDLQRGHYTGKLVVVDTDFGTTFRAAGAQFSGTCEFRKVRFPGQEPMTGAQFALAPILVETNLPGFQDDPPEKEKP
jgi:uncharacterized protein YjbI with pentapeptide repeats